MFKSLPLLSLPPKVFISYSHNDHDFVERLSNDLLKNGFFVWWDEWEINVGDSLISKIEDGISCSSNLVIVLSHNSVDSPWVREELKAALIMQLEEKRVIVLPALIDDCTIPLFLKDKKYADFRENYEQGLAAIIKAIQPPDLGNYGRGNNGDYHNDYVFDWGLINNRYGAVIKITCHSDKLPYTIFCEVTATTNDKLSERMQEYYDAGFSWAIANMLLIQIEDCIKDSSPIILIQGDTEAKSEYKIVDPNHGTSLDLVVKARRLGIDPGSDIVFEWGSTFRYLTKRHYDILRSTISKDEQEKFYRWFTSNPIK